MKVYILVSKKNKKPTAVSGCYGIYAMNPMGFDEANWQRKDGEEIRKADITLKIGEKADAHL